MNRIIIVHLSEISPENLGRINRSRNWLNDDLRGLRWRDIDGNRWEVGCIPDHRSGLTERMPSNVFVDVQADTDYAESEQNV
jgi:hypothetical protein